MNALLDAPPSVSASRDDLADDVYLSEFVAGEWLEKDMGWNTSEIAAVINFLLLQHVRRNQLGRVAGADAGYQCFCDTLPDDPDRVRKPDVSFISFARLPRDERPEGHCRVAPDLAVEVVSQHDTVYELEQKIQEYLSAGVRLVWVVIPVRRSVRIHRADRPTQELRETDDLTGEDVVPGFRCRVAEIFDGE